jgi:hypothetical protein
MINHSEERHLYPNGDLFSSTILYDWPCPEIYDFGLWRDAVFMKWLRELILR